MEPVATEVPPIPPVEPPQDLENLDARENLNADLAEVLADATLSPETAWSRTKEVLLGHGFDLPFALMDCEGADGEDVYGITDTVFLYFAFFQDERGWFECYAEVLTEPELTTMMESVESEL